MSSKMFHRGVISRSLSTDQVSWDDTLGIIRDFSRLMDNAINETSPDMRQVAVGNDYYFWKHSTWLGDQDNTWLEYAWSQYVAVKSLMAPIMHHSVDNEPSKILMSGQYPAFYGKTLTSETREYYYINSMETRIMEDVLEENGNVPNRADCTYKVVDLQDLEDGSLVNYFDSARVTTFDILTPNLNMVDRMLDSIKVGGMIMLYNCSGWGSLYEDALKAHEAAMHRFNVRVAQRQDFEVYHLANEEIGIVLAYKTE
jgi:hypothetical protein